MTEDMTETDQETKPQKALKVKRSKFIANTFTLVGGNIIAEAITFALIPIITRLYPPQAFGIFSILTSIALIFLSISNLRYNVAIQLPLNEEDADALALLGMLLVLTVSLLLFGVILICGKPISSLLKIQNNIFLLYFIPAATFLGGIAAVLSSWYLRGEEFKRLALSKISGALGDRTVTLGLGFGGLIGPEGLVAGRLVGYLFNNLMMVLRQGRHHVLSLFSLSKFKRLKKVGVRYKEFPKYVWSVFFRQLSMQMPVILLGIFFSPTIVGYFALSRRALTEPILLIGEALSRSTYQKLSETHRAGRDLAELAERLFHYLMVFVIFPMVLLGFIATELFSLFFGEKWHQAGVYAGLLVPTFITIILFQPIGGIFDLLEKQKESFLFSVLYFLVSAISIVAGGMLGRPLLTVGLFSLSTSLIVASRIVWLLTQIGVNVKKCARILGLVIARTMVFLIPVIVVKYFGNSSEWMVVIIAAISFALYIIYLLLTDIYLRNEARLFIKHYRQASV